MSGVQTKGPKQLPRPVSKNWRRPTLAESIKPLPSARLCLTAVFGMGTGRTTALWPPRNVGDEWRALPRRSATPPTTNHTKFKEQTAEITDHQPPIDILWKLHTGENKELRSRVKIALFPCKKEKESDQAARPISISPLNGLLRLHA